jgi:hypothetical protein
VATQTAAANDTDVPLDEEAKKLKLEQIKAQAQQAIAEAQKSTAQAHKDTLLAQLPSSDTKPIEGKVEVGEKVGLVAELVAHSLLGDAAATIAGHVPEGARVLLVEDRMLAASDWRYALVDQAINVHKNAFRSALEAVEQAGGEPVAEEVTPPLDGVQAEAIPVAAALITANTLVGSAASLAGMFRTDYSITHRDVTFGATPLIAAVAAAILASDGDASAIVDGFQEVAGSGLVTRFGELSDQRARLERAKLALNQGQVASEQRSDALRDEAKALTEAYDNALGGSTDGAQTQALKQRLDEIQGSAQTARAALATPHAAIALADAVLARFDAFATAVLTPVEGAAYPPLVAAALREQLHGPITAPEADGGDSESSAPARRITHVLYVAAESAGAETIARQRLFGRSGRMGYLGGVQVSFLLLDVATDTTISAGTQPFLGHMHYDLGEGRSDGVKSVPMTPRQ